MIIEPRPVDSDFLRVSAAELRAIKPKNLGGGIVGFSQNQLGGQSVNDCQNALFFHGFFATENDDGLICVDLNESGNNIAFQALKTAEPSFTGGADGYGFGKEPQMVTLDVQKADEALQALATAKKNQGGINPNAAHTILEWVTQKTRNALFSNKANTSPYDIRGACGLGQGLVGHQCEQIGVDVQYHQVANLSDFSTSRHAFNVLTLPIEDEEGNVRDKHYLVDTTFRQFFINDGGQFASGAQFKDWGAVLTQTQDGRDLADELLSNGFIELNEERARLYVEAQIATLDESQNAYVPAAWEAHDTLQSLTSTSTVENDYDLEELVHLEIETPADLLKTEGTQNPDKKPGLFGRITNSWR
jgi:hypothetical protein